MNVNIKLAERLIFLFHMKPTNLGRKNGELRVRMKFSNVSVCMLCICVRERKKEGESIVPSWTIRCNAFLIVSLNRVACQSTRSCAHRFATFSPSFSLPSPPPRLSAHLPPLPP